MRGITFRVRHEWTTNLGRGTLFFDDESQLRDTDMKFVLIEQLSQHVLCVNTKTTIMSIASGLIFKSKSAFRRMQMRSRVLTDDEWRDRLRRRLV